MAIKVSKKELSLFTSNFSLTYFIFFVAFTFFIMYMDNRDDYLKKIRKDFSMVTTPFVNSSNAVINFFENIKSLTKTNANLKDEIKQLNVKINTLSIQNQIRNFLVIENENLREANLLTKKISQRKTFSAEIIAPSIRGNKKIIIINKGSKNGLREGMPVMNSRGLVGQIYISNDSTSEVIPLISEKFAVNALQSNGKNHVIIYGDNESLVIPYFPASIPIYLGDMFVTSGLDNVYPSGIKIGKVIKISPEDKQFNKIKLKPSTFSNQFSLVTVIDY